MFQNVVDCSPVLPKLQKRTEK